VRLQLALYAVVRQRRVALLYAEKLLELGIGKNLSLVLRVLQIVFLDVGANVLCHIDSRLEFTRAATDELCHLLGDGDLLQKPRVDVGALLRLLSHHANGLRLESLQSLVQALEELAAGALALTERLDLTLDVWATSSGAEVSTTSGVVSVSVFFFEEVFEAFFDLTVLDVLEVVLLVALALRVVC
jgi:hypothetical protein